jgi:hypothetical protein
MEPSEYKKEIEDFIADLINKNKLNNDKQEDVIICKIVLVNLYRVLSLPIAKMKKDTRLALKNLLSTCFFQLEKSYPTNCEIFLDALTEELCLINGKCLPRELNPSLIYQSLKKEAEGFPESDNIKNIRGNLYDNKLILNPQQRYVIPETIFELVDLTEIYANDYHLNNIPKQIVRFTKLRELHLAHNELNLVPNVVGDLSNLCFLDLSYNRLNELPHEIGNLVNLSDLYLAHNNIRFFPREILNLTRLSRLDAHCNLLENNAELPRSCWNLIGKEHIASALRSCCAHWNYFDLPPAIWGKLARDIVTSIIIQLEPTLQIFARCQLEYISKDMTKALKYSPHYAQWTALKLWRVIPVPGVSWLQRHEGYYYYQKYALVSGFARFNAFDNYFITNDPSCRQKLHGLALYYLVKSIKLFDPDAIGENIYLLSDDLEKIPFIRQMENMGKDYERYPKREIFRTPYSDSATIFSIDEQGILEIENAINIKDTADLNRGIYNRKFQLSLQRVSFAFYEHFFAAKKFLDSTYGNENNYPDDFVRELRIDILNYYVDFCCSDAKFALRYQNDPELQEYARKLFEQL